MKVDLKDLTQDVLFKALPHTVAEDVDGRWVYNIKLHGDDARITDREFWVAVEGGKIEWSKGQTADPDATLFEVLQGGVDTLIAFQTYGMKAATSAMLMGYISTSSIKKAEKWFKLFRIGEDVIIGALKKEGIEVGDTSLPIYEELMLA